MTDQIIYDAKTWTALLQALSPSSIIVLTDEHTAASCLPYFEQQFHLPNGYHHISVAPGEESKSLETAEAIYSLLLEDEIDRKALLINIGGGMVTDLGGFVAATFKRGIRVIHVPTTHLGMVDAALGGKNGVNFRGNKNQIGTHYPAIATILAPGFLKTLAERELKSGWIETVKHALIADPELWQTLQGLDPVKAAVDPAIIRRSAAIKVRIAAEDAQDLGVRQSLNFGHTVGHAIEAETSLLHGEAIAIGLMAELYLSTLVCRLDPSIRDEAVTYIQRLNLPKATLTGRWEKLRQRMLHDKKNAHGEVRFALISHLGRTEFGIPVSHDSIQESIDFAMLQYNT